MIIDQKNLSLIPLFSNISEEALKYMFSLLKEKTYAKGEFVFREGDYADTLFIIKSGEVEVRKTIHLEPYAYKTLAINQPGDIFGEMALFSEETRSADVVTREETILWKLEYKELFKIIEADPSGGIKMLKIIISLLVNRVKSLNIEIITLYELGRLIPSLDNLKNLLELVFDEVMKSIKSAQYGFVAILNNFNQEFDVYNSSGPFTENIIALNDPLASWMLNNKKPLMINDPVKNPILNNPFYAHSCFLASPFLHEGEMLGYIFIYNPDGKNYFNYNHQILLSAVCSLVGTRISEIKRKEEDNLLRRLKNR